MWVLPSVRVINQTPQLLHDMCVLLPSSSVLRDKGLIELAEACKQLRSISLHNTQITDRALYAVAANCS